MNAEPWHKIIPQRIFLVEEQSGDRQNFLYLLAEHHKMINKSG
jgi:hypothetical protein